MNDSRFAKHQIVNTSIVNRLNRYTHNANRFVNQYPFVVEDLIGIEPGGPVMPRYSC